MTLIDRYILKRFVTSYLGSLVSMLLLYIVLDVFTKLDDFMSEPAEAPLAKVTQMHRESALPTVKVAKARVDLQTLLCNIGVFYAVRLPVIFDLINGFIVLLAATFTLGWMEKQNELLPLLAAGVRLRRVFFPAWLAAVAFLGVSVANREVLIPALSGRILRLQEDPQGNRPIMIQGGFDEHGVHFDGKSAYPEKLLIMQGRLTMPAEHGGNLIHLTCQEMYYRPATAGQPGGWWLNGCTPARLDDERTYVQNLGQACFFISTDLSFERLTRRPNWFLYQSTLNLLKLVDQEEQCPRRTEVIATLHGRITKPLAELLVVLIGVPLLVGCPQRSLYIKVGSILGLFALSQVLDFTCAGLARNDYLDPSLAAWLPVLIFGPWSLVASDATRT